jgi:hypothetical protein
LCSSNGQFSAGACAQTRPAKLIDATVPVSKQNAAAGRGRKTVIPWVSWASGGFAGAGLRNA